MRNLICTRLRQMVESGEINDANWSVMVDADCPDLESLVSIREGAVGNCAAWVCAIASEQMHLPEEMSSETTFLLALGLLNLTQELWSTVEHLPPMRAVEQLELLCFGSVEAA